MTYALRGQGGRVIWGQWRALTKSPTVQKLNLNEDFDFCDIVGKIPSCSDQVDEVREEQSAVGGCQALLWIRVSTPVKELKDSSLTRGH